MNQVDLKDLNINAFGQVHHEYIGYQSLTDVPKVLAYSEAEYDFSHFMKESTQTIIKTLHSIEGLQGQAYLLGVLQGRQGANFIIDNKTSKTNWLYLHSSPSVAKFLFFIFCNDMTNVNFESFSERYSIVQIFDRILLRFIYSPSRWFVKKVQDF